MTVTQHIWTDLARRESDGLEVTLLWNDATGRVKVAVADSRLGESFEVHVGGADALAAFNHPFAYAADASTRAGRTSRVSPDLQLQS